MAENMSDTNGMPHELHNNVYTEWGEGGWGMILTGKTQSTPFCTFYSFLHVFRQCPGGQNIFGRPARCHGRFVPKD
jgi:2,4-dienoyl-CoA reductase-like NADH-dependent reductase (Old Yellow Enzyme family)